MEVAAKLWESLRPNEQQELKRKLDCVFLEYAQGPNKRLQNESDATVLAEVCVDVMSGAFRGAGAHTNANGT